MKYTITYYYDGEGKVEVDAETEEEARDMFFNGVFSDEEEWGENYNIETVEKVNK